jgi:hypothetical protein
MQSNSSTALIDTKAEKQNRSLFSWLITIGLILCFGTVVSILPTETLSLFLRIVINFPLIGLGLPLVPVILIPLVAPKGKKLTLSLITNGIMLLLWFFMGVALLNFLNINTTGVDPNDPLTGKGAAVCFLFGSIFACWLIVFLILALSFGLLGIASLIKRFKAKLKNS